MKVRKLTAAAVAALFISVPWAVSQTTGTAHSGAATTTDAATASMEPADTVTLPAWPITTLQLTSDSRPVAASFSLGSVEGIDQALLDGVTANGYVRKVDVDNESYGQVLISSVAKNNKEATIAAEGLTAQFDATGTSELFPETSVEVTGSKTALVAALKSLSDDEEDEETLVEASEDDDAVSAASDGSSNDIASDYTTPTAGDDEEEDEPVITYFTTTEGCSVRVDADAGLAYVQNKLQTLTDGVVTEETECSDSGSYPLAKSSLACGDEVDIDQMKAWTLYSLYYVDDGGETHTVDNGDCTKEEDEFYTITEDESQCGIFLDFNKNVAVPQSALVYTNRNNAVVQARGCEDSTLTDPIELTENVSNCTMRHDYAAGISYEQSMWTYVLDGVTYVASACADDDKTFDQQTVYADASGKYICDVVTDIDGGTATLQSRKAISVDGTLQYITECTPDTSTRNVYATTSGCMDMSAWTHDVSAGVSYGQKRFYLEQDNGSRYYVTACQTSGETYPHDHEITGYQYHDDQLYAYPLTTVTVTANGNSYTIATSTVLDGAPQFVYSLAGTTSEQTGESSYEGCDGYYLTNKYEQWERPDETVFLKAVGEGNAVGPREVCDVVTTTKSVTRGLTYVFVKSCTYGGNDDDQVQNGKQSGVKWAITQAVKNVYTNKETGEYVSTDYSWGSSSLSGAWATDQYGSPAYQSCSSGCPGFNRIYNSEYWSQLYTGYCASQTFYNTLPTGW